MIPRPKPERFRLRRTMMFMNAQKPGLIKDACIYGYDSIMLDLEDAVAENQKDAARISPNPRDLMMAENVAKVIASTPYFKDGFSFQTGVGGPSLAANLFLEQYGVWP